MIPAFRWAAIKRTKLLGNGVIHGDSVREKGRR